MTVKQRLIRVGVILATGFVCFIIYFHLYTQVLGLKTPKTVILENENRSLLSKLDLMNQKLEEQNKVLLDIQMRDNVVYRAIFGMNEIPSDVRNAGIGGVDRYSHLENLEHSEKLISTAMKVDVISKKTYIQSKSFDDISLLAKRAGDMAQCIPAINPVSTDSRIRMSSRFGYRVHPISHAVIFHSGIDFSGPRDEPVYATGDGVVESVLHNYFGYGNCVIIDHGFGYKTRYAHLHTSYVTVGQKVSRGERIAGMGSTGQSTGTHLHYEVIYKGKSINPANFLNNDMDPEDYAREHNLGAKG